jgi:hypothetical protein
LPSCFGVGHCAIPQAIAELQPRPQEGPLLVAHFVTALMS